MKVIEQSYEAMQLSSDQNIFQPQVQYKSSSMGNMGTHTFEKYKQFSRNQKIKSEKISKTDFPAEEILLQHQPRPPEILSQHQPRPPEEILPQHQPRPPEPISLKLLEQLCNSKHKYFGFW